PHNPKWIEEFEALKANFETTLKDVPILSVEHVGSTAIRDLIAKPVIDIDIVIKPEILEPVTESLVKEGYIYIGESGIIGRHAFWQPNTLSSKGQPLDGTRRHNLYVIFEGCECLRGHRDLKRILLEDEQLREEYGDLKRWLVNDIGVDNIEEYSDMKNEIMVKILRKAGWTEDDLAQRRERRLREVMEWDGKPEVSEFRR
ncbi:putative UPF0157 protein YqkA, partial [Bisporella sp. PMI_857]